MGAGAGPIALLTVGLLLGMRHATDADHVVAVTTIVARSPTARAALAIGALWGLGHTATVLFVGGAIIVFGAVIPPRLGLSLEMAVALMLIVLGSINLAGGGRRAGHVARGHAPPRAGWRPLVIGVVHGLAGSAAVALLVLATVRDAVWAALYLLIFGAGTVLGMVLLTVAMTLPLAAAARRFQAFERAAAVCTGGLSLAFGLFLVYRLGVVEGLFSLSPHWAPR